LTLGELIRRTERRLRAARLHYGHGTDSPRDEAAYLVLRGLGLPFDADLERKISPQARKRVEVLLHRRIKERIPAAYLLKEAWLGGVPFYVDRRVIIPRSHIAELLAERVPPWLRRPVRRVLDLCTGSGCLAILAARAFPAARVDAADVSAAALAVARRNVRKHRLQKRIRLIRSDLFAALGDARYDLVVSNPPYVTAQAMRRLPQEYRYEPGLALAGGRYGLDIIARIIEMAPKELTRGGILVCEVGENRKAVERAWPRAPFLWPSDEVFILERARTAGASRTLSTPPRARR
jgi:ribosomal protein L3 glutamine methyltransferase